MGKCEITGEMWDFPFSHFQPFPFPPTDPPGRTAFPIIKINSKAIQTQEISPLVCKGPKTKSACQTTRLVGQQFAFDSVKWGVVVCVGGPPFFVCAFCKLRKGLGRRRQGCGFGPRGRHFSENARMCKFILLLPIVLVA